MPTNIEIIINAVHPQKKDSTICSTRYVSMVSSIKQKYLTKVSGGNTSKVWLHLTLGE